MKLIVLMPLASPWSRNLVKMISSLGHQVLIIDISYEESRSDSYMSIERDFQTESINQLLKQSIIIHKFTSKQKYIGPILSILRIRKIAKQFNPDAMLVLYSGIWGFVAFLSKIRPFFLYIVGSDILLGNQLKRIVTKIVLKTAKMVFSNGNNLMNEALKITTKIKIKNIYLGIDTSRFYFANDKHEQKIIIICTRGFEPIYNNKYLIEGLSLLPQEFTRNLEVFFTSGGSLLSEVKSFASANIQPDLLKRIYFLDGVSDSKLVKILSSAHIYVSLSLSDGSSISLIEALSCGIFPVLSNIPANREWIDSESGILVSLNKPKQLALALEEAIQNKEWREQVALKNRKKVILKANAFINTQELIDEISNNI